MRVTALLIWVGLVGLQFAGRAEAQTRPIRVSETIPLRVQLEGASVFFGKCDGNGNLFLPQMIDDNNFGPVIRLSADGTKTTRFVFSSNETKSPHVLTFGINQDAGVLYMAGISCGAAIAPAGQAAQSEVADCPEEMDEIAAFAKQSAPAPAFLGRFSPDGERLEQARLGAPIIPLQVGVLNSGDLIIAGLAYVRERVLKNFLGVFRPDGELVRELKLPPECLGAESLFAVSYAKIEMAGDGTLFLMRSASEGPIYVISPAGELVRTIQFTARSGSRLLSIKASRDQLVVISGRVVPTEVPGSMVTRDVVFSVLDPRTGEPVAEYEAGDSGIGVGNLACYQSGTFTFFLRQPEGGLKLVRAKMQ